MKTNQSLPYQKNTLKLTGFTSQENTHTFSFLFYFGLFPSKGALQTQRSPVPAAPPSPAGQRRARDGHGTGTGWAQRRAQRSGPRPQGAARGTRSFIFPIFIFYVSNRSESAPQSFPPSSRRARPCLGTAPRGSPSALTRGPAAGTAREGPAAGTPPGEHGGGAGWG